MEESRVPVWVVMMRRTVTEPNYDDGGDDCHSCCQWKRNDENKEGGIDWHVMMIGSEQNGGGGGGVV